jgi:hypothetical protein
MTEKLTDSLNKHAISKSKIKKSPEYRCPKPDCGSNDVAAFV